MGDTDSEDRYDSEEDMETPAFGPSKKRRTRRERSQAASRSLGPRERGGGAPSRRGPPPLPPPSQPPSDSGSHATAAGQGSQRGSRRSDGDSSTAWSYVPNKSIAPKKRIQQSSSSAWEEVPPRSKKASSDTPGSEATFGAPAALPGRPRETGQPARSGADPPGGPSSPCLPASQQLGQASKTRATPHGCSQGCV